MTTLNLIVEDSADDARESTGGGVSIVITSAGVVAAGVYVGARFTGVTIDSGDTINSATPSLYAGSAANDDAQFEVYCEDTDDAAAFTTDADNISNRVSTTATVDWSTNNAGGVGYVAGPDIATAVQEVIDRAGWASGNDLAVIYLAETGVNFTVNFFDNDAGQAPKLDIDYTEAGDPDPGDPGGGGEAVTGGGGIEAATYEVWLTDALGSTLDIIDDWFSLTYTRLINDVGSLELVLNGDYPTSYLKTDGRVYVYRNGKLENDGPWFIRKYIKQIPRDGAKTITVYAQGANQVLSTRIAAYPAGASQVSASDYADNLMKAITRSNLGSTASDTSRSLSGYLAIESNASYGAVISKSFARDNVLEILQEISQSSITAGSGVYFDVVSTTTSGLEFRTYRELRGTDHTFPAGINPVILSPDRGNLVDVELSFDRSEEITYVYAGGGGIEDVRLIRTASSQTRMNESPFNRREYFLSYGNVSGSAALQDEAEAALRAGRPRRSFSGTLVNIPGTTEYKVHWDLGDMVTAEAEGESYNCVIDSITVTVQGNEGISGNLRVEEE